MKYTFISFTGYLCRLPVFLLFALSLLHCSDSGAEEFHNALSLQGFTGLLNTPTATVTEEGRLYALYSNQRESTLPFRKAREESYLFSIGLFSFVELGGRLTDAASPIGNKLTDLSANLKVSIPFIPKGYYLPDIAFGMQDIGGGAKNLQTTYLVATKDVWRVRFSAGYGFGPDRLKGAFGGVEFKAFDWLYLLGENDAKETNVGVRLVSTELFGMPVNLQVTAKSSLDHKPGNIEFGFGMQIPLGFDHHNSKPAPITADPNRAGAAGPGLELAPIIAVAAVEPKENTPDSTVVARQDQPVPGTDKRMQLAQLSDRLVEAGFQNIRIGREGNRLLVVEYENSRYNNNELDGIGVVAGIVVSSVPAGFDALSLIIKKKGIRLLEFRAPLRQFYHFLQDASLLDEFNDSLQITNDIYDDEVEYFGGDRQPSWLQSSVMLYPGLKTFVGTEVGVFDYLLSLKLDYYLNAWKGAVINARWDIPVDWSKNFNDGEAFRNSRNSSRIERVMFFQALKVSPDVMINVGGGMVLHDAYGTVNEAMWTPAGGNHRFMIKQAYVEDHDSPNRNKKNVYLGSYRYFFDPLDLYLTGTGGKFYDNDKGFTLELKRFFGDTAISVFYKNSRTTNEENVQVGGIQISLPLTPRRDMKPYLVQVRGNDDWKYSQETKIVTPGSANTVNTSIGNSPQLPYNLEHIYYNRDRLSEQYIRKHLLRLRDAYLTYLNQ